MNPFSKIMSINKKFIIAGVLLLVLIIGASSLMFMNKEKAPSLKPVTLEYWGINEPESAMKLLIGEYMKIHPNITINYSDRQFDDLVRYRATLLARLKEATGPSIFRIHSTWVSKYFPELTGARGELSNVSSYKNRFYPIAYSECSTSTGEIYCVPLEHDGLVLLYNINMFDQAGLQKPVTWEDLRVLAMKLTIKNGDAISRGGLALGTALNVSNSTDVFGLMLSQSGVSIPSGLDTEAATAALTFYRSFATKDKVWNSSMQNSTLAFATEKVAMMFAKKADIQKILSINPTLKFGVTGVPQLPGIDGKIKQKDWASLWVEAVSADLDEDQKNAAWDFLNWLSQPSQQKMLFAETLKIDNIGYTYSDKSIKSELKDIPYLFMSAETGLSSDTSFITDNSGNDNYSQALKAAIDLGSDALTDLKVVKAVLSK